MSERFESAPMSSEFQPELNSARMVVLEGDLAVAHQQNGTGNPRDDDHDELPLTDRFDLERAFIMSDPRVVVADEFSQAFAKLSTDSRGFKKVEELSMSELRGGKHLRNLAKRVDHLQKTLADIAPTLVSEARREETAHYMRTLYQFVHYLEADRLKSKNNSDLDGEALRERRHLCQKISSQLQNDRASLYELDRDGYELDDKLIREFCQDGLVRHVYERPRISPEEADEESALEEKSYMYKRYRSGIKGLISVHQFFSHDSAGQVEQVALPAVDCDAEQGVDLAINKPGKRVNETVTDRENDFIHWPDADKDSLYYLQIKHRDKPGESSQIYYVDERGFAVLSLTPEGKTVLSSKALSVDDEATIRSTRASWRKVATQAGKYQGFVLFLRAQDVNYEKFGIDNPSLKRQLAAISSQPESYWREQPIQEKPHISSGKKTFSHPSASRGGYKPKSA